MKINCTSGFSEKPFRDKWAILAQKWCVLITMDLHQVFVSNTRGGIFQNRVGGSAPLLTIYGIFNFTRIKNFTNPLCHLFFFSFFTKCQPFSYYEKCFLFDLKSSFHSQDILFFPCQQLLQRMIKDNFIFSFEPSPFSRTRL